LDLFQDIEWGTEKVLEQTVSKAKDQKLAYQLLEPLNDIDTIEDLNNWRSTEAQRRPYISVVIPALNEQANIAGAVHNAEDEDAEVIVVDGGSTDNTVSLARAAGAMVLKSNRGRAFQQNKGAEEATGEVLLFLHADTRLPEGYVNHVFEALMDPDTVLGAFRFKTDLAHPLMTVVENIVNLRARYMKLPYGDQAFFMRKVIFASVKGFPDVMISEDLFLTRRLSRIGQIRIAPAYAVTSARRWRELGILRTTIVNYTILACCILGISPNRFAKLYPNVAKVEDAAL
jgi:hypothetical protein